MPLDDDLANSIAGSREHEDSLTDVGLYLNRCESSLAPGKRTFSRLSKERQSRKPLAAGRAADSPRKNDWQFAPIFGILGGLHRET